MRRFLLSAVTLAALGTAAGAGRAEAAPVPPLSAPVASTGGAAAPGPLQLADWHRDWHDWRWRRHEWWVRHHEWRRWHDGDYDRYHRY